MTRALFWACLAVGLALRVFAFGAHEHPRGDVVLDVGVARSLAHGDGWRSGFDRGTALVVGAGEVPPQAEADQRAPLWSFIGARLGWPVGSTFRGLKIASLALGLLLLALLWREARAIVADLPEAPAGLPELVTALGALSFALIDFSGNGSLYVAQACIALLLVALLARPRPPVLALGLLLGAGWLLNHQALVLVPVPLVVLLVAAPRGERLRAAEAGLLVITVAVLLQVPWWWRNAEVFGSALHSTNLIYPLHMAGFEPALALEAGRSVARFPDPGGPTWLLAAQRAWLPGNVMYLFTTGLALWPGLLALVAAGALPLAGRALRERDRRVLAALCALAALLVVALGWPGLKLRYLVPMTPLVLLLGARLLGQAPGRLERALGLLVALGWGALLVLTLDDLRGIGPDARPERWRLQALLGAAGLLAPLVFRHVAQGGAGLRRALVSGALVAPIVTATALSAWPHTAYHSTPLSPDAFGQQREISIEREARTLARARAAALESGARVLCGPVELLEWSTPALVTLPVGAGLPHGDEALAALADAGRIDHVFVFAGTGWPEALAPGERWLGGRLEVVAAFGPDARDPHLVPGTLSRVVAP